MTHYRAKAFIRQDIYTEWLLSDSAYLVKLAYLKTYTADNYYMFLPCGDEVLLTLEGL